MDLKQSGKQLLLSWREVSIERSTDRRAGALRLPGGGRRRHRLRGPPGLATSDCTLISVEPPPSPIGLVLPRRHVGPVSALRNTRSNRTGEPGPGSDGARDVAADCDHDPRLERRERQRRLGGVQRRNDDLAPRRRAGTGHGDSSGHHDPTAPDHDRTDTASQHNDNNTAAPAASTHHHVATASIALRGHAVRRGRGGIFRPAWRRVVPSNQLHERSMVRLRAAHLTDGRLDHPRNRACHARRREVGGSAECGHSRCGRGGRLRDDGARRPAGSDDRAHRIPGGPGWPHRRHRTSVVPRSTRHECGRGVGGR